jgi:catechol 2,3-dioxygenase-like lactoylglutathione lyase family enzyme
MIGYVTVGTNDLPRAAVFYDALLAEIGATRLWGNDQGIAWGVAMDKPSLAVMKPYDGQAATRGNGTMVGLVVMTPAQVNTVHAKALALGGTDEGAAGPRGDGSFYCGYFRDLDGNKLNVFCMPSAAT